LRPRCRRDITVPAGEPTISAEIVGSPAGTVMSRLHRGRKQLREKLADYAKELGYKVGGSE